MSDSVIKAENLGKRYTIGHQTGKGDRATFREALLRHMRDLWNKTRDLAQGKPIIQGDTQEEVWALKGVSFEIRRGEAAGIIGRNGAGKSTLLKILSRITEPTEGRVTIKGRVASLLEVGTGFHSELSGRENIYLNGTILGMTRAEIKRKFDAIVGFAEVEKYLDTPVKRYSSGMYVRLAFAVAAHLEPEILVVDEVLAVGDAEFQKKCLGKMGEVAKAGRTVLFVSHNMGAVQSLCGTAFHLESGRIAQTGDSKTVVSNYLSGSGRNTSVMKWRDESAPGNEDVRLKSIGVNTGNRDDRGVYQSRNSIFVEMQFTVNKIHSALCIGFDLLNSQGETILRSYQTDMSPADWPKVRQGDNLWRCTIPGGLLNGGIYNLCPRIGLHNLNWIVYLGTVVQFEVILDHGVSPFWSSLDSRSRPGIIAPVFKWESGP
ncbi:MAG: ABC transporter ATP-binding protein [Deltaproteobacteria bacterium]|nr:ABC transporter ATP-binding protein [Deltaproteobacteria bacterium]